MWTYHFHIKEYLVLIFHHYSCCFLNVIFKISHSSQNTNITNYVTKTDIIVHLIIHFTILIEIWGIYVYMTCKKVYENGQLNITVCLTNVQNKPLSPAYSAGSVRTLLAYTHFFIWGVGIAYSIQLQAGRSGRLESQQEAKATFLQNVWDPLKTSIQWVSFPRGNAARELGWLLTSIWW